jgi:DNA-binding winged helix-turn-helix (wHTH) protein
MTDLTLEQAMDAVYAAIKDGNRDLDQHIAALREVLARDGVKQAVFDPKRLAQANRQGRKLMQSYFKKRGVEVAFASE